jgi:hypothetical protein
MVALCSCAADDEAREDAAQAADASPYGNGHDASSDAGGAGPLDSATLDASSTGSGSDSGRDTGVLDARRDAAPRDAAPQSSDASAQPSDSALQSSDAAQDGDGSKPDASAGPISCAPRLVACDIKEPTCPANQVASVVNGCYGPCVVIDQCSCMEAADCPHDETYACHRSARHCGPYVN